MSNPPRYSQRHFNWGEPVAADGSTPLDILMKWLRDNRDSVRDTSNLFEAVKNLCLQLNHCGFRCTVDNIIRCLTMTAWMHREEGTGVLLFDDDLYDQYFDGQHANRERSHREKHMRTRLE
ncbi:hypothetical protein PHYSODRAFT_337444 [Phytophthora sojae]|uniref:Uncharacterized protein n=1 Tax=Phytophthora sojae (strain P6497) TaxID=1094619 RepID=G5A161_PHYSP|nr:hypothetical protein PHYSODRAFT_337444 [Phytophthora sojae]EGZ10662.1 hypothetical protein PHYSODRAFT_337444 [Phytophthora sojae]|eukprot:XP_009533407.1 hypothetical protein PHYSODRAFT_337444 [Phytophthora sojae]